MVILSHMTAFIIYRHFRCKHNKIHFQKSTNLNGQLNINCLFSAFISLQLTNIINIPIDLIVSLKNKRNYNKIIKPHFFTFPESENLAYCLNGNLAIVCPELLFLEIAQYNGIISALLAGLEMCGSYCVNPADNKLINNRKNLTSRHKLIKKIYDMSEAKKNIRGIEIAKKAAKFLSDGSASPQESILYLKLTLPNYLGGLGIQGLCFNYKIIVSNKVQNYTNNDVYYTDLAVPTKKIAIEYDSNAFHSTNQEIKNDRLKSETLKMMGWHVFSFTPYETQNISTFNQKISMLLRLVNIPMKTDANFLKKQKTLFLQLG